MARPSIYSTKIEPRLKEIREWRDKRETKLEIAAKLGVGPETISRLGRQYPELKAAMALPLLTPEEQKQRRNNQRLNYTKAFASATSFIRNRLQRPEEMARVEQAIVEANERLCKEFPDYCEVLRKKRVMELEEFIKGELTLEEEKTLLLALQNRGNKISSHKKNT